MSDQLAPSPPSENNPPGAKPPSVAAHLRDAVEELRAALPTLSDERLAKAVEGVLQDASDPARSSRRAFAHNLAYAVQDVEAAGIPLDLPQAMRGRLESLARTAPGLENRPLLDLLDRTPALTDRELVRDIRRLGVEVGRQEDQEAPDIRSRVDALANRTRLSLDLNQATGADAQAPTGPDSRDGAPGAAGSAHTRAHGTAPAATAAAPGSNIRSQPQPVQAVGGGLVSAAIGGVMDGVLRGFRSLGSANTQPWEPATTPLADRLRAFEARQSHEHDQRTLHDLEQAGSRTLDALRGFQTGAGAAMLNRIREAAKAELGGMAAVLAEMRGGGKFATLRHQFNNAFAEQQGFAAAYDRMASALTAYGGQREALSAVIGRQPGNIAAKFERLDRDIGAAADETPSRRDGKTMLEDAGRQFVEIVHRALDGLKNLFDRSPKTSGPSPS
jgi:hypothetical protein